MRTVALVNANLIVVVDAVRAADDAEHVFDLAVHLNGEWHALPEGKLRPAPEGDGYAEIADLTTRTTDEPVTLGTNLARLTLAKGSQTEVMTGAGVGESTAERVPVAIFRRKAKATTYVWAISLDGNAGEVEMLASAAPGEIAAVVKTPEGPVQLLVNSETHSVQIRKEPRR